MKTATANGHRRTRNTQERVCALIALLPFLAASGAASAQWAVIDAAHIKTQGGEFMEQAARWKEQGQQWVKEYNEWKQQYDSLLAKFSGLQTNIGMPKGIQMTPIPEDFNVVEKCGPKYGNGVAGVLGTLTGIDINSNPFKNHWEVCRSITVAQNMKYNEMVVYITQGKPQQYQEFMNQYNKYTGRELKQGEQAGAAAEIEGLSTLVKMEDQEFTERQKAYDTYIEHQTKNLEGLTRTALRGKPGLIQQITTTAVMRNRLCGSDGGKCERIDRAAIGTPVSN